MKQNTRVKIILSACVLLLAAFRVVYFDFASRRMDNTFLLLLVAAVLIHVLPWERLTSFKAAGVEFTLDKPQVKGALEGLGLKRIENKQIQERLSALQQEIEQAKGSRILWIDDKPHEILGERRLLRALGVEIVTATSSAQAKVTLRQDNDFDLIISDIQRPGLLGGRETIYDGLYFVKGLREKSGKSDEPEDEVARSLPVIFYTAYTPQKLAIIESQVGPEAFPKEGEICDTIEGLVTQAIKTLAMVRTSPIKVRSKKKATSAR